MQHLHLKQLLVGGVLVFLLTRCVIPGGPSPDSIRIFHYSQGQSLCSQGVLVTSKLPETDPSTLIRAIFLVQWDNGVGVERRTSAVDQEQTELLRSKGSKETSFRLAQFTTAPTQSEAITRIPPNNRGSWDNYYTVEYMRSGLTDPKLSLRCLVDTPAIDITVPGRSQEVLLVIEDPSSPAKLRVVLSPIQ